MVRLFGHLSSLNLPSWTRHSYGNQHLESVNLPGAALEAGPSNMKKDRSTIILSQLFSFTSS